MAPELSKSASDSRGVPRHFIIAVFDMEKNGLLTKFSDCEFEHLYKDDSADSEENSGPGTLVSGS
jgi:hypothetical protein